MYKQNGIFWCKFSKSLDIPFKVPSQYSKREFKVSETKNKKTKEASFNYLFRENEIIKKYKFYGIQRYLKIGRAHV